jgi:hypothetical protein
MTPDAEVDPLMLFRVLGHRDLTDRLHPMAFGLVNHGLLRARGRDVLISRTTATAGADTSGACTRPARGG